MIGIIVCVVLVAAFVYAIRKSGKSEQPGNLPVDPVIHETPDSTKVARPKKSRKTKEK